MLDKETPWPSKGVCQTALSSQGDRESLIVSHVLALNGMRQLCFPLLAHNRLFVGNIRCYFY